MILTGPTSGIPSPGPALPAVIPPVFLIGGNHYNFLVRPSGRDTGTTGQNVFTVYPVIFANSLRIDAIAIEITTAIAASVSDWAIWEDRGDMFPRGRPACAFGSADGSSTGVKVLTCNWEPIAGRLYWIGFRNTGGNLGYRRTTTSTLTSYAVSLTNTDLVQSTNRVAYGISTSAALDAVSFDAFATRAPGTGTDWFPLVAARCT